MKKSFINILTAVVIAGGFTTTVFGQVDAGAKLVDQAKASSDSQLGSLATDLTGKAQALDTSVGTNAAVKSQLNSTLTSLTGGKDVAALTSAYSLVKSANLTPAQLDLAKQIGNVASAYVVKKNFSSLDGSQGDVNNIVNALRAGKIKSVLPSLKNISANAKLTDQQKQILSSLTEKYVPSLKKLTGAEDSLKKVPGF